MVIMGREQTRENAGTTRQQNNNCNMITRFLAVQLNKSSQMFASAVIQRREVRAVPRPAHKSY